MTFYYVTRFLRAISGRLHFYRIAVGPRPRLKAFMIRSIRPLDRPVPALRSQPGKSFVEHLLQRLEEVLRVAAL